MGSVQVLAAAIKALVPTSVTVATTTLTVKVYDTSVTDPHPADLYSVVNVRVPNVNARSDASTPHSVLCRVVVTVGAKTPVAVRDMADAAVTALDCVRPAAAGWTVGPLLLRNTRGPEVDPDVTFSNGTQVTYGVLEFDLTASRLP